MLRWLAHKLFPDFEDEKIIFKIKVKKAHQEYSVICWYEVTGYWKYSWQLFYTPLGVIEHKTEFGKWKDEYKPRLLERCEEVFVENARRGVVKPVGNKRVAYMRDLIARIDNDC